MKEFKSIKEQTQLLKDRGVVIDDNNVDYVREFLLHNSYYTLINGYKDVFLEKDNIYLEDTHFSELVSLYRFDNSMRTLILEYSLLIENRIKSLIAYFFSQKYGHEHNSYLKRENFIENQNKDKFVIDLVIELRKEIENNRYRDNHIAHYLNHYNNVPLWVLVRSLNFRQINSFYSLMKDGEQKKIDVHTGKNGNKELKTFLKLINGFRNAAAHNERLFNLRIKKSIIKKDMRFFPDEYEYARNNFYALIVVFKKLLSREEFHSFFRDFFQEFSLLEENINSTSFDKIKKEMGLPENWKEIIHL